VLLLLCCCCAAAGATGTGREAEGGRRTCAPKTCAPKTCAPKPVPQNLCPQNLCPKTSLCLPARLRRHTAQQPVRHIGAAAKGGRGASDSDALLAGACAVSRCACTERRWECVHVRETVHTDRAGIREGVRTHLFGPSGLLAPRPARFPSWGRSSAQWVCTNSGAFQRYCE
jgi:hypothetical protein